MCSANACPTSDVLVDSPMNNGVVYSESASAVPFPTAPILQFRGDSILKKNARTASLEEKNIQSNGAVSI
jgi:hypothetical protein